jgi:hypothetical protein
MKEHFILFSLSFSVSVLASALSGRSSGRREKHPSIELTAIPY